MDPFKTLIIGTPPSRTYTGDATGLLTAANNLSDVADAQTALNSLASGTDLNLTKATAKITLGAATEIGTIAVDALGGLTVTPKATKGVNLAATAASSGTGTGALSIGNNVAFSGTSGGPNYFAGPINVFAGQLSSDASGEIDLNYNNGAAGGLYFFGGGTTSRFNVSAAANGGLTASGTGAHTFGTTNTVTLSAGAVTATEISDPAAPAANSGTFYFRDNGSGKTQFVVRFPTGAVQVVATEP